MNSTPMLERIGRALRRAGLEEVPGDVHASLADHGMDSLIMVLSVAELECEFALSIPTEEFSEDSFRTLDTLRMWLEELGAQ